MAEQVRILIPLDGSKLAEHALAYVPVLMPLGISQVDLVSVVENADRVRRGDEDEERERNLLTAYQRGLAGDIRQQTGLQVESKVLSGSPAVAILQEANSVRPAYLVISTHGASGVSRWRLGSVADKVIRGAACPTLVVGPRAFGREDSLEARLMPAFKSILVPLDGSAQAEQALPAAARFVDAFGAEAHLVSVVSIGDLSTDSAWAGVSPKLDEDLGQEARDYLEHVSATVAWQGAVHIAVRFGSAADGLEEFINENGIDLVIMSSHGRGGLLRTALGSTTDRLLGSAAAPLLIIRGEDRTSGAS